MPLNLRTISKFGFVMVVIGYLMPFIFDRNVFTLVGYLSDLSSLASRFGGGNSGIGFYIFLIYLIFITSVIGVVLGVLLFTGKSINTGFEWAIVLIPIVSFIIIAVALNKLIGSASSGYFGLSDASNYILQSGGYMIIFGLIFTLIGSVPHGVSDIVVDNRNQYPEKLYTVTTPTKIFHQPYNDSSTLKDLIAGEKIFFQQYAVKKGQTMWYSVKAHNVEGWCNAEYLKEC